MFEHNALQVLCQNIDLKEPIYKRFGLFLF